jgi:hypothetical protein
MRTSVDSQYNIRPNVSNSGAMPERQDPCQAWCSAGAVGGAINRSERAAVGGAILLHLLVAAPSGRRQSEQCRHQFGDQASWNTSW